MIFSQETPSPQRSSFAMRSRSVRNTDPSPGLRPPSPRCAGRRATGNKLGDVVLSSRARLRAQVAQLVEQRTENPRVGGSIPSLGTIHFAWLRLWPSRPIVVAGPNKSLARRESTTFVDRLP